MSAMEPLRMPGPESDGGFTPEQQRALHAIVRRVFMEEVGPLLREMRDACAHECHMNVEQQKEIGHLFGVFRDAGARDVSDGIEKLRDAMTWHSRMETLSTHVGRAVVVGVLMLVAGGLGTVLVLGIRSWIASGGK